MIQNVWFRKNVVFRSIGIETGNGNGVEILDVLWSEMRLQENMPITETEWENFMIQYIRRNAERHANLFIVNATTPAQFFHALRRQVQKKGFLTS